MISGIGPATSIFGKRLNACGIILVSGIGPLISKNIFHISKNIYQWIGPKSRKTTRVFYFSAYIFYILKIEVHMKKLTRFGKMRYFFAIPFFQAVFESILYISDAFNKKRNIFCCHNFSIAFLGSYRLWQNAVVLC